MNRSKLFIGLFIFFILIVITIVLLACTVFVVRNVYVDSDVSSSLVNEDDIIASSGLTRGRSIITISKEKVINSIEKNNPYVQVVSVSRVFPNKVIVEITVRTGVMVIASSTGDTYALVDTSLKVLNVSDTVEALSDTYTVISGVTFDIPQMGAESLIGSQLSLNKLGCAEAISDIAKSAEKCNIGAQRFATLFKEIAFYEKDGVLSVHIRTQKGVTFVLDKSQVSDLYDQMYFCLYYYTTNEDVSIDRTSGYIFYSATYKAYTWSESLD